MKVAPADIRAFARRDREPVRKLKLEHWAKAAGESPPVALAHALHAHAKTVRPAFPSPRYLADDLEHHIRLKGLIDRVAPAFAIRRTPR